MNIKKIDSLIKRRNQLFDVASGYEQLEKQNDETATKARVISHEYYKKAKEVREKMRTIDHQIGKILGAKSREEGK